jgi:hypothetical protein
MKISKTTAWAGLFLMLMAINVAYLSAHAPKKVGVAYDEKGATLSVTISHKVKNPQKHFIKRIRIYINKEQVLEKNYQEQDTHTSHQDSFNLSGVKSGDTILVRVSCNKFGGKRAKYVVN